MIKGRIYTPLPECNIVEKTKENVSKSIKAKDAVFKQDTPSESELAEETLRNLAKLFGGLISMHDAIRELKAKGFNYPERLIKKMLREGSCTSLVRDF